MQGDFGGVVWIALGGALGGMARFYLSRLIGRWAGEAFPWGTLTVNASGAFALGLLAGAASQQTLPGAAHLWAFAALGFLGSYTTVSSFSLQTLALATERGWQRAGANILLSLALCLGGAALGLPAGAAAARLF